jgi:tetratricopeptide (TPR) repeat protein
VNYWIAIFLSVLFLNAQEPATKVKAPNPAKLPKEQPDPNPVQQEYEKLLERDETVLNEVEKLIRDFEGFEEKGAAGSKAALTAKIEQRIEPVKKAYDDFLQRNPRHVDALIAYGSFLNEIGEEEAAIERWEKARELDPKNPSPWNNLANVFGHVGPVKKAFPYYEKAIELNPTEPVYLQNLATTVYLFRKDAAEVYRIDEEGVFNKALDLYRRAIKLDPANLVLAIDYAQSYYGIRPTRVEDALAAWKQALTLAKTDVEKEGIYVHLARVELNSGRFDEAQQHLELIKNAEFTEIKERLQRNLNQKRSNGAAKKTPSPSIKSGN